ncbi:MAG: SDR family oxidoreductase [bacterium]|nr:SDR family oxidoreductase [bacterium]
MKENTLETFRIDDRVAIITGGAGFLGVQHAEALLDGGATVALVDVDGERLKSSVKELRGIYGADKVHGYTLDISSEKDVKKTVATIASELSRIDILINNAANNPQVSSMGTKNLDRLENFPFLHWQNDIAVGLTGAYLISKYAGSYMSKKRGGVILNIASDLGVVAPNQNLYRKEGVAETEQPVKPVTYSVVKHGLIGLTKYLATYWPKGNIRANSVSFGGVEKGQPESFLKRIEELIPMGRMAKPGEYKASVLFLCSDASSYMNGANVIIDGGRTVW